MTLAASDLGWRRRSTAFQRVGRDRHHARGRHRWGWRYNNTSASSCLVQREDVSGDGAALVIQQLQQVVFGSQQDQVTVSVLVPADSRRSGTALVRKLHKLQDSAACSGAAGVLMPQRRCSYKTALTSL